jgi:hypothetical protein
VGAVPVVWCDAIHEFTFVATRMAVPDCNLAHWHWLFPVSNLTVAPDARTDSECGAAGAIPMLKVILVRRPSAISTGPCRAV